MRKTAVIVLVLLLLGLTGIEGCTPPGMEQIKSRLPGKQEVVQLRGLSIEFEQGKPHFSSKEGERLPILRAGQDFEIGLKINNYMPKPASGSINIYNLARYASDIHEEQGFSTESGTMVDNKIYPGVESVEFGPYNYNKEKVGEGLEDNLITELNLEYDALISADLCFSKEQENIGIICNNNEILTENTLKGDAGFLPVSIERVTKEANVRGEEADFYLTLRFRNFEGGIIENNKITNLNAAMVGGDIECGNEIILKDGVGEVECSGKIIFGEEEFVKTPVDFSFGYPYKVIRTISYKVI